MSDKITDQQFKELCRNLAPSSREKPLTPQEEVSAYMVKLLEKILLKIDSRTDRIASQ